MPGPFSIENPGVGITYTLDQLGNSTQSGTMAAQAVTGTLAAVQPFTAASGVNTSAEAAANILSTLLIGNAQTSGTQLSDVTRDYMCYVTSSGGGTNNTLTIGPNSTATAATIFAAATLGTGTSFDWRLPAGWFIRFTGTATLGIQSGIGC
jgi:hypothetical protein